MPLRLALTLTLVLLLSGAVDSRATELSACQLTVAEVDAAAPIDLEQVLVDGDLSPACRAQTVRAARRVVALLQSDPHALTATPDEDADADPTPSNDADDLVFVELFARGLLIRDALRQRDFAEATAQHRALLASMRRAGEAEQQAAERTGDASKETDWTQELDAQLAAVGAALDGRPLPPIAPESGPIEANWTRHRPMCGLEGFAAAMMAIVPTAEDVLAARGQPEQALQRLVDRDWRGIAESGFIPPRFVEFGRTVYGDAGLRRELEIAAASIRLADGIGGKYAQMPLFGAWRPIPVATKSFRAKTPEPESGEADLQKEWRERFERALSHDADGGQMRAVR